ncbi:MAG: NAD(P)/FAD-dependent oxidoreductase [Saprospiraceae bacterium]|nr:NAD(P)/FAD-dependent oxidoreductase [Saprospiraceae bacterium]
MMKVAVIGGGAAGFFAAIHVKINHPNASVVLFEKSQKLLSKVKISGGGRCNVTNGCADVNELVKAYPRGGKKLKKAFHRFNTSDTMEWFEKRNVPLLIQEDGCVFPVSQSSQSIIDCFLSEARRLCIDIQTGMGVKKMMEVDNGLELTFSKEGNPPQRFDKVIVATGGSPKRTGLAWLEELGHRIEEPVPSLFTFNMPNESITKLMGIVVKETQVKIQGEKLISDGPLLITHWGMSGPAILKLSAFGARILADKGYEFQVQVNWANERNNNDVLHYISSLSSQHQKKMIGNIKPYGLQERLWHYLLERCSIAVDRRWGELGGKSLNKIVNILTNDTYAVKGKTTFKEEFVTCGGVSLKSIDLATMESKKCKNLYFAGEVMDIDAITGGYNFQAAWTTAFIAGELA